MNLNSLKKAFQNVTSTTVKKTGEQVQITRLAVEKSKLAKELETTYAQIGRRVCELGQDGTFADDAIVSGLGAVADLKKQLETLDDEINLHKLERDSAQYQLHFDEDGKPDIEVEIEPLEGEDVSDIKVEPLEGENVNVKYVKLDHIDEDKPEEASAGEKAMAENTAESETPAEEDTEEQKGEQAE